MTRLVVASSSVIASAQDECRKTALNSMIRLLARISADEITQEMRRDSASQTSSSPVDDAKAIAAIGSNDFNL